MNNDTIKCANLPKVSIIVPVYNAESTLNACVMSIIGQSYKNIECILIENGLSDKCRSICSKYAVMYKSVKVRISSQKGVSEARNLGLKIATGNIIGFCDADDYIEKTAIETIVAEFQRNSNIIGVIGAFYVFYTSLSGTKKQYMGIKRRDISMRKAMALTIGCGAVMGSVWNKYYRAEVLQDILFDPELAYCEDMHFNIKVMSNIVNGKIALIEKPLYNYKDNELSVTHQFQNIFNSDDEMKYIIALKKIMLDCSLDKRIISLLKMKIACFAIDSLVNMQLAHRQKIKLVKELRMNYCYLLINVYKFNWKWNLKRAYQGAKILLKKI